MNDARELACLLKKVYLKTSEVKVGDGSRPLNGDFLS